MSARLGVRPELLSVEGRHELIEAATARSRVSAADRIGRLRANLWPVAQTAAAAGISWLFATEVLGHKTPFFAPVAAIMALGVTRGQRARRAIEVILGVALGVGLGDLLVRAVGVGVLQLALAVLFAMGVAIFLKAGRVMLTEAAVSATLVVTISPATQGVFPPRLIDALAGGLVALLFSQLLFPVNPIHVVRDAAKSVLGELAETLGAVAKALEERDLEDAESTLARARRASDDWSRFEQALDMGREAARFAPPRRRKRRRFADFDDVGIPIDLMVTDVRVIARGAVRALLIDDPVPDSVPASLRCLSRALDRVGGHIGDDHPDEETREVALRAARLATGAVNGHGNLSLSVLVAYIQATSADVLRTLGHDRLPAHEMVGDAVTDGNAG